MEVEIRGEGCTSCTKTGKASPWHSYSPQKRCSGAGFPARIWVGWIQKRLCLGPEEPVPHQCQSNARPVPKQRRHARAGERALRAEHEAAVEMDETLGECCEVQIKSAVLRAGSQRGGVEAKRSLPTWAVSDVLFIHSSSTPGNGNNFF